MNYHLSTLNAFIIDTIVYYHCGYHYLIIINIIVGTVLFIIISIIMIYITDKQ